MKPDSKNFDEQSFNSPIPSQATSHFITITNADPSALGLFGLAIVTFAASSEKFGFTSGYTTLIPWAIFLGAFAQLFASIGESQRNNTFGTTAFGAFALFWFANASTWLIKMGVFGQTLSASFDDKQLGLVFTGYFIFGLYMTIAATMMSRILFIILCFVDILFLCLSLSNFNIQSQIFVKLAGVSELIISFLSFYASAASVLNTTFNKVILPVGKPLGVSSERAKILR
jgi:succinate-acetate transporter protein